MIQTGYDLPTALALCGRQPTGWDRLTCANGVFMENVNTSFGFRSPWLDDRDPLVPCARVAVAVQRACYFRAPTRILELEGRDFAAAAETCRRVPRPWVQYCFRGLGRDALEAVYRPAALLERCAAAGAWQGACLYGAARAVADRFGVRRAAAFCARTPASARAECSAAVGGVLGLIHASAAAWSRACAALVGRYLERCVRAARAEVDPSGRGVAWG